MCDNATSQTNAIINVKSDVFANNSPMNELILPNFYDSSNQIVLHFLRDLDEYYRINNAPEPETIGGKVTRAHAKMRKKVKYRRERVKTGNNTWAPKVKKKVLVRAQRASDVAVSVTAKFIVRTQHVQM